MRGRKKGRLNHRQRIFIETYLSTWNALASARAAGYKCDKNTSKGDNLLRSQAVKEAIEARVLEITAKLDISPDEIVQGFVRIARDPRTDKAGGPNLDQRMKALRELGKLKGMYVERHLYTGATLEQLLNGADELEKARAAPPLNS